LRLAIEAKHAFTYILFPNIYNISVNIILKSGYMPIGKCVYD